eukprot:TRINITY_DN112716_c0_g1_i1.p1 TRINITY_DN112716_c0_g1~~TRINITY_DN112716_c0_g1_i1.p1  ORF type:complete len:310 (+),score=59.07 TRINITY_DN112716_c0_g1_i1:101-1030(+)
MSEHAEVSAWRRYLPPLRRSRMLVQVSAIAMLVLCFEVAGQSFVFLPTQRLHPQAHVDISSSSSSALPNGPAAWTDMISSSRPFAMLGSFAAVAAVSCSLLRRQQQRQPQREGRRIARQAWPWEDDNYSKITALKVQVGLQYSKELLDTLNELSDGADTETEEGLHNLLLDVVVALRRNQVNWRYGSCERLITDAEDEGRAAAATLQRWGLDGETKWGDGNWDKTSTNPEGMTEYLVVTLALSCYGKLCPNREELKVRKLTDLKEIFDAVSGVQVDELMQLDVQWIPEEDGDTLSAMEVTMKFPELVML